MRFKISPATIIFLVSIAAIFGFVYLYAYVNRGQ
jgi:hypothetical protein